MTTRYRDIKGTTFQNIVDTGTEGTKVASGTTAQRGSTTGQFRFNTTTGLAEYYTGNAFKTIDEPPTVTSVDVTEVDSQAGGNQTIVVTGTSFNSGATITFVGAAGVSFNASTATVDSSTQITTVSPKSSFLNAQEPYSVKVTNTNGLNATLQNQINVDTSPSWSTASGSLGTILDDASGNHITVSASDPDGDTIAYSETASVLSGAGLSIGSANGIISGSPNNVNSDTTLNFNLRATAGSKNADRAFSIIIKDNTIYGGNYEATYTYNSVNYKIHKFTSTGNFILPSAKTVSYMIVGGGGGGGKNRGGGGGAGGLVWFLNQSLSAGTYQAVVGSGGAGASSFGTGTSGGNSTFNSHTANGGGYGGGNNSGGGSGGSGGGNSSGNSGGAPGGGGGSNQGSLGYGYGNSGAGWFTGYLPGGGGGGAGAPGHNQTGGAGKGDFIVLTNPLGTAEEETAAFLKGALAGTDSSNNAATSSSSGTLYIAGGGGGSHQNPNGGPQTPGVGGGARGGAQNYAPASAKANTGGGGGGGERNYNGSAGADGVVVIRYVV